MKKLLIMLLAVVMVLGITSMVAAVDEYKHSPNGGWYINSEHPDNVGHYGTLAGVGWDNASIVAEIEQFNGDDHNAFIDQVNTGNSNYAGIGQNGSMNDAEIYQEGVQNFVRVSQWGDEVKAYVNQVGQVNRVRTRQSGSLDELDVFQNGYLNYARVEQHGTMDSYALVEQDGQENGAAIFQDNGFDMTGTIFQNGMNNEAVINQSGGGGI